MEHHIYTYFIFLISYFIHFINIIYKSLNVKLMLWYHGLGIFCIKEGHHQVDKF